VDFTYNRENDKDYRINMVTALEVFDSIQESIRKINQEQIESKEAEILDKKLYKKNSVNDKTKILSNSLRNKKYLINISYNNNEASKNFLPNKSFSSNKSKKEKNSLINTSTQNNESNHSSSCNNSKKKVNKLPLKFNIFSKNNNKLNPSTIITNPNNMSTRINKNQIGIIPNSYKNYKVNQIKRIINEMKINRGFSSKTAKANNINNSKQIVKFPNSVKKINSSKKKCVKSINKENQGNNIMKKIPTMKKKKISYYPNFIKGNNNNVSKINVRTENSNISFNNNSNVSYTTKNTSFNK
jgi:hypothetical protein